MAKKNDDFFVEKKAWSVVKDELLGCYFKPYPTPNLVEQNINTLLDSISFADKIIFGRTNYNKAVTAYPEHKAFYNEQAQTVIDFCNEHGIAYHIKEGTITK